jgi:hypothetical protein
MFFCWASFHCLRTLTTGVFVIFVFRILTLQLETNVLPVTYARKERKAQVHGTEMSTLYPTTTTFLFAFKTYNIYNIADTVVRSMPMGKTQTHKP